MSADQPAVSLQQATYFLGLLDSDCSPNDFCFRSIWPTADQRPDLTGEDGKQRPPSKPSTLDDLRKLNEQGAGAYGVINEGGHKADDITKVRAVYVDFDKADDNHLNRLALFPFPPSIVVESSPGKHHAYWCVEGMPLDEFARAQKQLIALLDSDPSVHDLPRVMRLPGFIHTKDKDQPFKTCMVSAPGTRYQWADLEAFLSTLPEPCKPKQSAHGERAGASAGAAGDGTGPSTAYGLAALDSACKTIRSKTEFRNDTLNSEAYCIAQLVAGGEINFEVAITALRRAALDSGLEPDEIENTLKSAFEAGTKQPRTAPEKGPQSGDSFNYADGRFSREEDGLYFIKKDESGEEGQRTWLSSPIEVAATTRDGKSGAWGRLLRWLDDDGVAHQWAMPLEMLQGDGLNVRQELAAQGLKITPGKRGRDLLATYIQTAPTDTKARCVTKLGWHGSQYVTPSKAIGEGITGSELVVFQSSHAIEPAMATSGTLEDWQNTIGKLSADNSRLQLSVCIALAGPLAAIVGESSGGFHLWGDSSTGKSTAQRVCCSVYGDPATFMRTWRATSNGLEGIAAVHNDLVLVLDELGQCEPKHAGEAAYMLANGQGKTRAGRTGAARNSSTWQLLYLSSGEGTLTALMAGAGLKVHAGQEVRQADIKADAGKGMGLFESLHDYPTANQLAVALNDLAARYHGSIGQSWLEQLVANKPAIADAVKVGIEQFVAENTNHQSSGQVLRVVRRFAVVAAAGELAIQLGLLPWAEGDADKAVADCFKSWLDGFGNGSREDATLLSQVRLFIEQHGASRFQSASQAGVVSQVDGEPLEAEKVFNRAGYIRYSKEGAAEYLVLPEVFKAEVCKGFDPLRAAKVLASAGVLQAVSGRNQQAIRIGKQTIRCYVLVGDALSQGGEQ